MTGRRGERHPLILTQSGQIFTATGSRAHRFQVVRYIRYPRTRAGQAAVLLAVSACPGFGQPATRVHPAVDPAHDLTAKEFVKDIGADFAALFDRRSIVPLIVGAEGVSLSTIPEQWIERQFAQGDKWGGWSTPGRYIGNGVVLGGIGCSLFVVSRKSDNRTFRSLSYSLVQGMIVSTSIAQATKAITHRLRPNGEDHLSFPSNHVTDSFLFATVFADHYGWKAALPGFAIAAYVGATRLEERKHHMTDVAAGAAIGILAGRTVSRRIHGSRESRFSWQVYPGRRGFTAVVRVALP